MHIDLAETLTQDSAGNSGKWIATRLTKGLEACSYGSDSLDSSILVQDAAENSASRSRCGGLWSAAVPAVLDAGWSVGSGERVMSCGAGAAGDWRALERVGREGVWRFSRAGGGLEELHVSFTLAHQESEGCCEGC